MGLYWLVFFALGFVALVLVGLGLKGMIEEYRYLPRDGE